jgi:non-ribosomal peptide synthetase component F
MKVLVRDIAAYDAFYKRLIASVPLSDVSRPSRWSRSSRRRRFPFDLPSRQVANFPANENITAGSVCKPWSGPFADVWEAIAAAQPERPVVIQGERVITWAEFDRRSDALAAHFIAKGLGQQAKVAAFLYNGPEYLEAYFAAFKGGYAPVNTNYRYGPEELVYLFDNADAEAIVFHAGFTEIVEQIKPRLRGVKAWVSVAEPAIRRRPGPTTTTPSWPPRLRSGR